MTDLSKQCILEVLSELNTEELISLGNTISQGLLRNKIRSREDAVQAIITYSPNGDSILRRKIITREILFSYLHKKKIHVTLPATKNDLINKILEHWKLPGNTFDVKYEGDSRKASNGLGIPQQSSEESSRTDISLIQKASNGLGIPQQSSEESSCTDISPIQAEDNMCFMAQQFSQWFYSMINENAPIGTEHFYPDASLRLNIFTDGISNTEEVNNNPEEICALLFQRRIEHNLFFNPNLSKEGTQGRMDPHGLVIVLACGTLHVNECCVGVFEQMFALARDPFADNNWKIKSTQLNLRSKQNVSDTPRLCDSELTSNYLALPDR